MTHPERTTLRLPVRRADASSGFGMEGFEMQRDIRGTDPFREAEQIFTEVYRPGEDFISDIVDLQRSPSGSHLLFTGTLVQGFNTPVETRICEFDLEADAIRTLTAGPNSDRGARTSPDGETIAFLSDRHQRDDFQLFFLNIRELTVTPGPRVDGWVEYLEWSPGGRRILLGVAGHGAELSSGQGAYKTTEIARGEPSWMPEVIGLPQDSMWRSVWILDIDAGELSRASSVADNIWEASWRGDDRLAVVRSSSPEEGAWYGAGLSIMDLPTGTATPLYAPTCQIALPRSSSSGKHLAFIEAVSSDRGLVAGELRLCDLRTGACRLLDIQDVDATYIEWRSIDELLVAGHRGLETVVLYVNVVTNSSRELWKDSVISMAGRYASVLGLEKAEDFAFVCESFFARAQIATVRSGSFRLARRVSADPDWSTACSGIEAVNWQAPDGLHIEGWLLKPKGEPPYATILEVHAGPILHWRPYWLGRAVPALMLLRRGYALFRPNPRGSSGRGQAFASRVIGDIGGAETADFLSGIDHLVNSGIADPSRLGVTGLSYGGLMTCWLTTQDRRFGAAVSIGPATNHVTHHLLCNIPQFVSMFLQDHYTNLSGTYYTRSPILHAHNSRTPTLLVCGNLDRCTPPEEALQFHRALQENGVNSVVINYPEEGHGVHGIPASIDFAARTVMWFESHLPIRPRRVDRDTT